MSEQFFDLYFQQSDSQIETAKKHFLNVLNYTELSFFRIETIKRFFESKIEFFREFLEKTNDNCKTFNQIDIVYKKTKQSYDTLLSTNLTSLRTQYDLIHNLVQEFNNFLIPQNQENLSSIIQKVRSDFEHNILEIGSSKENIKRSYKTIFETYEQYKLAKSSSSSSIHQIVDKYQQDFNKLMYHIKVYNIYYECFLDFIKNELSNLVQHHQKRVDFLHTILQKIKDVYLPERYTKLIANENNDVFPIFTDSENFYFTFYQLSYMDNDKGLLNYIKFRDFEPPLFIGKNRADNSLIYVHEFYQHYTLVSKHYDDKSKSFQTFLLPNSDVEIVKNIVTLLVYHHNFGNNEELTLDVGELLILDEDLDDRYYICSKIKDGVRGKVPKYCVFMDRS